MATDNESFNRDLYDLLKVRGYDPVPLDSKNQRVAASQAADVIQFTFNKDGKDYGKVWVTIDDAKNVIVYYDEEQQESPSNITPGAEYNDSWTGFLTHLKNWSQRRQLSFELSNKDRLSDDMRQRDYYKMKERVSEGYYPMGKKASYNDAVPNVKIILQHNRALEEGEQRYRNVAKIFLENQEGERFLAPTIRPGIARVYARHIAEGGVPNDDRWNHVKSMCEDYSKMAGFVRATRNNQFNEPAQELVNEGVNHYNNLRETLSKLAGHRGYQAYFESWSPPLMEDDNDDLSINELFVQETVDPRIESAMPILSRLKKPVTEMSEVDTLAEWADSIISEKLEMDSTTKSMAVPADKMLDEAPGAETLSHNQSTEKSNLKAFDLEEGDVVPFKKKDDEDDDDWIPSIEDFEQEEAIRNRNREYQKRKRTPANDVNEMDKSPEANPYSGQGHRKGDDHAGKPQHTAKIVAAKQAVKMARKTLDKAFKGDVDENFISMAPQAVAEEEVEEGPFKGVGKMMMKRKLNKGIEKDQDKTYDALEKMLDKDFSDEERFGDEADFATSHTDLSRKRKALDRLSREKATEDLDANQKRVGQLGPTEKVKNNNIGKLVGANESTEIDPELARIIEMARFKR